MIAIVVQPAPFSSCLGFDGQCQAGRARYGVYGESGAWHPGAALNAGPNSPTIY